MNLSEEFPRPASPIYELEEPPLPGIRAVESRDEGDGFT